MDKRTNLAHTGKPKGAVRLLVSSGEISGDQHAAVLVKELLDNDPEIEIHAMGGRFLEKAGAKIIVNSEVHGNKNGFHLADIVFGSLYAFFKMLHQIIVWRPKALVIIDYPDFNLRLATLAKFFGVKVIYHIPPKLWAWRSGRIKRIRKSVDQVTSIFPFEIDFYNEHGYQKINFIGHPFNESFKNLQDKNVAKNNLCQDLALDSQKPLIAVFPGSRKSELERHLPIVAKTIELLNVRLPDLQFIISQAPGADIKAYQDILNLPYVKIVPDRQIEILNAADVGILKSGTCNLEAAFCRLPFICIYTVPKMAESIINRLVKLKEFSLVNIINPGSVKEIMQHDVTSQRLADELYNLLTDYNGEKKRVSNNLEQVVKRLAQPNNYTAAKNAADLITAEISKPQHFTSKRLLKYLSPYKNIFYLSLVCMVLFGASDGAIPFFVKRILDGVFSEQDTNLLYMLPIALFVFAVLRALVDIGQQYLLAKIGHNIVRDLRNETNQHLLTLSPGFYHRQSGGNLLSRFTSDVVLVRELLTNLVASLIRDSIRIVALLATALYLDPLLGAIAFVVFPIGIFPVYRFGKKMRKLSKRGQEAIGTLSGIVQQTIIGNKVVKIFCREQYEHQKFTEENERLNRTFVKSELVRALTGPVNELLSIIAISAVILYGGLSVIHGGRTQGEFIAFLLSVFLLYDPFKKLSKLNNQIQQGMSGAERIFELLDTKPTILSPLKPKSLPQDYTLEFDNVSYSYEQNNNLALDDIKLTIPQNSKIALVGFSGAGKSTLVDLIPRFIDPDQGTIRIGGVDLRDLDIHELRSKIAMVDQHTFLFNDTVFNNIAYGKDGATEDDVIAAAKAAHAYDFIKALPSGFQTNLGESGLTLSGGERQRIAIARAILKNAPILILDEATASLDNKSEQLVQSALGALEKDRTTVVIAHRLSTVRNADCILVLEHGKIVESGSHDELLAQNGAFSRLYHLQFSNQGEHDGEAITIN